MSSNCHPTFVKGAPTAPKRTGVSAIGRIRRFAHQMETSINFVKTIVAAGLVAASTSAFAADITGAGATFPFPIYSKWADAYKKETGNGLNYQSIGSGGGIKQIQAKTVTFGATDMPLKLDQLDKDGLVQWPMVMSPPAMPSRLTTGTTPPSTVGNWTRPDFWSSSALSGMSEAPKVTVLAWICLMPPPDPID